MQSLTYKIIYKNNTSKQNVLNDIDSSDRDAASIKDQIARENGLSSDNFKIFGINPLDSTKVPLTDGETLTESYKIVELYQEELQSEEKKLSNGRHRNNSDYSLTFEETSQLVVEHQMEYQQIEPVAPPHVYGVFRISRMLKCFSKERFFELNPDVFAINIYQSKAKFPKKPQLTIPILMITKITRLVKAPCFSNKIYMQIVTSERDVTMCFEDKYICNEWIKLIKQTITYAKFAETKRANLKDTWRPPSQTHKVQLIDESKDIPTNQRKSNRSNRSEPSQVLFNKQEASILFQHFKFKLKIGKGSFGLVFFGTHKETDQVFAIKQLNKDQLIHRFQLKYAMTELEILKGVQHPFIVDLNYAFQTKENLYLAMNYCPNGNLKQLIQDNQKLTVDDAILYICQIILAIQYLHKKKIIYRDLKPENILMSQDYHVCLSDFGLSKTDVSVDEYAESFLGTPAYLAPEMATSGKATQATDIYGIGAVMYEMVHGRMLHFGTSISSILNDIQDLEPEIDDSLPKQLKNFLKATLEKDPSKRLKNPKQHSLFKNVNWSEIYKKKVHPKVKFHMQRSSLEWQISNQQIDEDYNEQNYLQNRVQGWIYSKPA